MKWFFKLFLIIFWFNPVFAYNFETKYQIKTRGITIGQLTWNLNISNKEYSTFVNLKDSGFFSKLYSFSGKYSSKGQIKKNFLLSSNYKQSWKTREKERLVEIIYSNMKIEKMNLYPLEKEFARVKYKKLNKYNDPLASFLNIVLYQKPSYTIDGRRVYLLTLKKKQGSIKVSIDEYKNIWADHKRNDLEYLEIFLDEKETLPKKILIKFRGSVFSLLEI